MKTFIIITIVTISSLISVSAQGVMSKTYELNSIQEIHIDAKWADLSVSFEDVDQVEIEFDIKINGEYRNESLEVKDRRRNGVLSIRTDIDFDDIDQMVTLIDDDGSKTVMTQEQFNNGYKRKKGWSSMNTGHDIDGSIKVSIPKSKRASIETTYGDIEAVHPGLANNHEIELHSTYGHIDLSIPERTATDLSMTTSYGEIYTDHDFEVKDQGRKARDCSDFGECVYASLNSGQGGSIALDATYDNIYLRKI